MWTKRNQLPIDVKLVSVIGRDLDVKRFRDFTEFELGAEKKDPKVLARVINVRNPLGVPLNGHVTSMIVALA